MCYREFWCESLREAAATSLQQFLVLEQLVLMVQMEIMHTELELLEI
jgi:hypothetical protein